VTSAELDRKVRQLDSDVHAIYRMLDKISGTQREHGKALADVKDSLSSVRGTQARHGNRLSEIDGHLEGIDSSLTDMRATQARHGNRLDGIDGRLDRIDGKLDAVIDRLGPGPAGGGQAG
jgi:septation ring formation regulator EzrA